VQPLFLPQKFLNNVPVHLQRLVRDALIKLRFGNAVFSLLTVYFLILPLIFTGFVGYAQKLRTLKALANFSPGFLPWENESTSR
jgi:hypothetical protein